MDKTVKTFSLRKVLLYSFLPVALLMIFGEVAARCYYFQVKNDSFFALAEAVKAVSHKVMLMRAGSLREDYRLKYEGAYETLFSSKGHELLMEFQNKYEQHFVELVLSTNDTQTKLIVLYLPSTQMGTGNAASEPVCRSFFQSLCEKYDVKYLDITEPIRSKAWNDITLLPHNGHYSRFGNRVVASELNKFMENFQNYRSPVTMSDQVDIYGDLAPSKANIWNIDPLAPYRVITNTQGFRNAHDLGTKTKQRILVLGDSFTFGPYLPNRDTYPAQWEQMNPDLEVVNAGVVGYTISDEVSLFIERAQYVGPDITVLQVLDNDLYGLFYFKMNQFDRRRRAHSPTPLEESFLRELQNAPPENSNSS